MKEHLEEGSLQALLDGERDPGTERQDREHLAACPSCRERYAQVRAASRTLASALALLDPVPALTAIPGAGGQLPPAMRRPRAWRRIGLARAATFLLTVSAAASATIPGSPVRNWLESALRPRAEEVATTTAAPPPQPAVAAFEEPPEAGVSVEPANGVLRVVLSEAAPGLEIRARLTEGSRGAAYASGPAADARFRTALGRIEVAGLSGGELRIEIPRSARAASVEIDGRTYLTKEGDQLRLGTALDDTTAAEVLFRVQP